MHPPTFREFLRGHLNRYTAVGDLARDIEFEAPARFRKPNITPARLRAAMERMGASDDALAALDRAEALWRAECAEGVPA